MVGGLKTSGRLVSRPMPPEDAPEDSNSPRRLTAGEKIELSLITYATSCKRSSPLQFRMVSDSSLQVKDMLSRFKFVEKFPQRARPTHWRPLGARANVALRFLHVLAPFSRRSLLNVPDGLCIAIYNFFHFPMHHLSVVEACGSEMLLGVYTSDRISEFQNTRRYPKGECCSKESQESQDAPERNEYSVCTRHRIMHCACKHVVR